MEKQWIIYGAGYLGEKLFYKYGAENVAYFVDTYKSRGGGTFLGKNILSFDELKEVWNPEIYKLTIAMNINAAWEVFEDLKRANIKITGWDDLVIKSWSILHVYTVNNEIVFDYDESSIWSLRRASQTVKMLKDMFEYYKDVYAEASLDFYVYYLDNIFEASRFCELLKIKNIFAYSEIYGVCDVISIPDYKFIENFIDGNGFYTDVLKYLSNIQTWEDERAFWTGNLENDLTRRILVNLSRKYPEKLFVNYLILRNNVIKRGVGIRPTDWFQYKYFIDIRGCGWTDRVKYLLAMKRPLLLVDRPYKEYYFDRLKPMVHYVPVKEDLSDLIEKIELLDGNPELYDKIVNNAFEFCKANFTKERIRQELHERVYKYGVKS